MTTPPASSSPARARTLPDLSGATVLQVIPELSAGGAERTVLEVTEALRAAGARALVASEGGQLEPALERLGGTHVLLPLKAKTPWALLRNRQALIALARQENVDLIHARSRAPGWSALLAARHLGIPFVTTYHGAYSGGSAPKRFYNSVMARGDVTIANSEWIANHVREVHRVPDSRLVTIPRGVDPRVFDPDRFGAVERAQVRREFGLTREGASPDTEDGEILILLPGRLTEWKGQRVAIAALARLPLPLRARCRLVLIGDAQGRESYRETLLTDIAASGLGDQVRLEPHRADLPRLLAAADLVLAPSTRPEAFGRTAPEASAMACPVVASGHGGALETVVDGVTGHLVPPGDEQALADTLARLISLPARTRAEMGAAGRAHVLSRFTTQSLQAATLAVYSHLLSQEERKTA